MASKGTGKTCKEKRASFVSSRRWTENSLDEDIAKMFEPPDRESLRIMVEMPPVAPKERRHHFDETDYKMHRGESFPHMHQPLKALHSRPSRRHRGSSRPSQTDLEEEGSLIVNPQQQQQQQCAEEWFTPEAKPRKVGFYLGEKVDGSMDSVNEPHHDDGISPRHLPAITRAMGNSASAPSMTNGSASSSPMKKKPQSPKSPSTMSSDTSPDTLSTPLIQEPFQFPSDDVPDAIVTSGFPNSGRCFTIGEGDEESMKDDDDRGAKEKDVHHRHHHKHHHRHKHGKSHHDDLTLRQRPGTDMELPESLRGVPTEVEEAMLLQEGDLNLMASHRFDDARGMRRHKIQAKSAVSSFIHAGRMDGCQHPTAYKFNKKLYDHQPHEIFVELDELWGEGEEREWKETARWIKYEEDLEEGSNRWGKPHVASLSFHSLLNLRKCLEHGTVLLDLEEKDLPGIAYRVVEAMVVNDQIKPEDKGAVMRALLLRHKHVVDHHRSFAGLRRNFSSNVSSLTGLNEDNKSHRLSKTLSFTASNDESIHMAKMPLMSEDRKFSLDSTVIKMTDGGGNRNISIDMKEGSPVNGVLPESEGGFMPTVKVPPATTSSIPLDNYIMRKIPEGSEASTVLVGGVDFLDAPTIAFVRLAEGTIIPSVLEVPIPIRFMFILLGPTHGDLDYHEIGRSISTLMADRRFHTAAYRATERQDLMHAINEFLDESVVLSPGNWDPKSFDPTLHLSQRKNIQHSLRRRRRRPSDTDVCVEEKKPAKDPLRRRGRCFGGLIHEVKTRYPLYWSDIYDSFSIQCLASIVFIYFAALSGAISFGGLLADKTKDLIGVSETMIATSISGVIFSLLSGQPLMIIGVTGPVLLFDESLFSFCDTYDYDFLTLRVWIGIWVGVVTTLFVALEGSFLLRYITRFTEEILAALISLIFIYEAFVKLFEIYRLHPLTPFECPAVMFANFTETLAGVNVTNVYANFTDGYTNGTDSNIPEKNQSSSTLNVTELVEGVNGSTSTVTWASTMDPRLYADLNQPVNEPNTALLSTILMFGTFFIAFFLREFRNGQYLGRMARRALGDFGVPIAIVIMVSLDYVIQETYTQKLQVPNGLQPSNPDVRGWFISPLGATNEFPIWLMFGSLLPALLLFILLFMEVQICELIINKKERKLCKGTGFHIDILLVSYLNVGNGFIGGPWMSAAIVRAISHIMSLTIMSRTHAPGDKPHILTVKEQRVTNLGVSLLVGISVLMAPILRHIPVPVLFGIFLYMGFVSMIGVQFFDRLRLFFMPVKHHPDLVYVKRVATLKMHLFTAIQVLCLVLLWGVKSTDAAIGLPFILLLMIPARWQLKYIFSPDELQALDGTVTEVKDPDEEEDEPDFYEEAMLPG